MTKSKWLRAIGNCGLAALAMALAIPAAAQTSQGAAAKATDDDKDSIVVTARRIEENLQDVPLTVSVVSAQKVEELNLLTFEDIARVVSGMQLTGSGGFQAAASARGVTFQAQSAASQTVATYINEAPTSSNLLFQAIYDIGQFEVLKGPQGTLRGISAPSGSITLTTRRARLDEIGASINGSITDKRGYNLQGGISLPIIKERLAIRLAGLYDQNEGSGVRSVNSTQRPFIRTKAFRGSVRFEPTADISVNLMYQLLRRRDRTFGTALFGTGAPGTGTVTVGGRVWPVPRANFNGPPLTIDDRAAVADERSNQATEIDIFTGQVDWRFAGQKLSYVGSWQKLFLGGPGGSDLDTANLLPGVVIPSNLADQRQTTWTHEVRLSSAERVAGIFDYTLGFFYRREVPKNHILQTLGLNPGAFGTLLAAPVIGPPNYRYSSWNEIFTANKAIEKSFFANLTAHIGDKLEITFGGRALNVSSDRTAQIFLTPSVSARIVANAAACTAVGGTFGTTYADICDVPVASRQLQNFAVVKRNKPFVYNASISYKITPDLMVYFTHGTAWRAGPSAIGIVNGGNRQDLTDLQFLDPEKSKSYEAGFKWTFLDGRGRLNVDYYHQTFDGLIYTGLAVPYLSDNGTGNTGTNPTVGTFAFTLNAPAKVDGIDVDFAFDITKSWEISTNFSWTKGRLANALIPCQDSNFDGTPDAGTPTAAGFLAAGVGVAKCRSDASSTIAPPWNISIQSEYRHPVTGRIDGFIRGLFTYQPRNPNSSLNYVAPGYGLLNLYLGLRGNDRSWELSLYGKNITGTFKVLSQGSTAFNGGVGSLPTFFGPTGYRTYSLTAPREFGANLRYSFGGG